jgi:hypothetical protein
MDNVSTITYLPPNDRYQNLYKAITPPLDEAINKYFVPPVSDIEATYNPSNSSYDSDKIINLLGAKTLSNLLSGSIDKSALSMILTDLLNMKGTLQGFETLLQLLNIQYEQILFDVQPNGCTDATLVFKNGQRINLIDIQNLEQFANELFPLCLTLTGITNCDTLISPYNHQPISLGEHFLDINFVTDLSKLDLSYGISQGSSGLSVLLCNDTTTDLNATELLINSVLLTRIDTTDLLYVPIYNFYLDNTLILDVSVPSIAFMFETIEGRSFSTDLIYSGYYFDVNVRAQSEYYFKLDIDLLDKTDFRPLDGYLPYTYTTNAVDSGFILDKTLLDSSTTITINNTIYSNYVITSDLVVNYQNYSYSSITEATEISSITTSCIASSLISKMTMMNSISCQSSIAGLINTDLLNFDYYKNSQYLPALN